MLNPSIGNRFTTFLAIIPLAVGSGIVMTFLACYEPKFALIALIGGAFLVFLSLAPLFWLGAFLLAFIPFNALISQLLGGFTSNARQLFALWKEALIIVGTLRVCFLARRHGYTFKGNRWLLVIMGGLFLIYLITLLRFPSSEGIFAFNLEVRFIGILILFMLLPLGEDRIRLLLKVMLGSIFLIAVYGVIQYFWDYERLLHLLYYGPGVSTEFDRRIYSFTLNVFDPAYGSVIGILIVFHMGMRKSVGWVLGFLIIGILSACLTLTYTRSGWLGLVVGLCYLIIYDRQYFFRYFLVICGAMCLMSTVMLLTGSSIYNSSFGQRLETLVSQNDLSSLTHKERMGDGLNMMIKHPGGIGLGQVGNVQARFKGSVEEAFYTENWILQVGVQTGIVGALIYILLNVTIFIVLLRKRSCLLDERQDLRCLAGSALAAMTVAGVLIPVWGFLIPMAYTWSLVGMALRRT